MSGQGLADRLAAETERCLRLAGELGDRLESHLAAQRDRIRKGARLPVPDVDVMRVYREYRQTLEKLRAEAILQSRLRLDVGEVAPMSEEEYRAEYERLQRELLQTASREDLERVLQERPVVRLPAAAGLAVLDVAGEERPVRVPPSVPFAPVRGRPGPQELESGPPAAAWSPDPDPDEEGYP